MSQKNSVINGLINKKLQSFLKKLLRAKFIKIIYLKYNFNSSSFLRFWFANFDNIGECATTSNNFYTVEQNSESEDEEFNFIHTRARRTVLPSNLTTDQNTQINIDTRRQEIRIKHLQTVLKQEIVLSKEISVGSQTIQGFAAKKKVVEDERDKKIKEINENADATLKNLDAEKQKTLNIIKNNKEKLIKIQKALATLDEALN
ncbi:hypothetical protein ACKWTF_000052 [Chironomus riparius]